jgi:hypothetical protein
MSALDLAGRGRRMQQPVGEGAAEWPPPRGAQGRMGKTGGDAERKSQASERHPWTFLKCQGS